VIKSLDLLARGSPAEVLLEAALALNAAPLNDVIVRSRLEPTVAAEAARELLERGSLIWLENGDVASRENRLVIAQPHWRELGEHANRTVSRFHAKYPLRRGVPREELKSRLNLSPRVFNAVITKLVSGQMLIDLGNSVARTDHAFQLNDAQQSQAKALMRRFAQQPFSPPTLKECQAEAGEELVNALIEQGELIAVSTEILFRKEDYDSMVLRVRTVLEDKGQISLAEVRDLFNTSRKYAQALLEHLDAIGVTRRHGDFRKLR
jgi:selenocysteine-specific elongation factor